MPHWKYDPFRGLGDFFKVLPECDAMRKGKEVRAPLTIRQRLLEGGEPIRVRSPSSAGDCYDNAMCESFFATLECELLDRQSFMTQAEARMAVFEFLEGWYNPHCRHSGARNLSTHGSGVTPDDCL